MPTPDLILQGVEAITGSRTFSRAARQRSFLKYVVEETLAGRAGRLKEYSIGIAVLGKDPSFDPRLSSIVRTEARKLRARLAKYYETEGRADPVRIELPLGTYAPVFSQTAAPPLARLSEERPSQPETAALRVLVLPFENRSSTRRDEVFCDGLADELSHVLTQLPNVEVVARSSAFQYKGRPTNVSELAERFNLDAVLEGSVRRSGGRVRVLAQIDNRQGQTIWSHQYERKHSGGFSVEQEIAQAIANEVVSRAQAPQPRPSRAVLKTRPPRGEPNARAYQDYLQGVYYWKRHTLEDFGEAVRHFRRAIERDVRFTRAYTNLAYAYLMLPVLNAVLPSEFLPKARAAALRALEIDPQAGEAHIALALPFIQESRWREAGEEFRAGLELSPSDSLGRSWHGMYHATLGHASEALREHQRALQLDPESPVTSYCYGQTLYLLRRYDQAAHYFRSALALDPSLARAHASLGMVCLQQRNYATALSEMERAAALTSGLGRVKADLGYAYAAAGNKDKAREILSEFLTRFRPASFPAFMIAEVYIGLGDQHNSLEWLHRAMDQKDLAPFLSCDPVFDPLRADPRFSAVLKRANLE